MSDNGEESTVGTQRFDRSGLQMDGGDVVRGVRTIYHRLAEEGVCPFCGTEMVFVDETAPGGSARKMRYECACGAHGTNPCVWEAGFEVTEVVDGAE